ncbi:hypothetical protein D8S78_10085 [Natrialba swarupiae]|nr:hypothetical protein [Natrialba swarupiae]
MAASSRVLVMSSFRTVLSRTTSSWRLVAVAALVAALEVSGSRSSIFSTLFRRPLAGRRGRPLAAGLRRLRPRGRLLDGT